MAEKKSLGTRIAIGGACIIIALIVTLYIFVWRQPTGNGIDKEFLSNSWTGSAGDWIGLILFYNACFWLSGLWSFFGWDDDEDPWKAITKVSFIGGAIGIALILLA